MASIIEELSEEDQQLKSELDMLVERLQVWGLEMYVSCGHSFSYVLF
jgi:hypothetical protein